MLRLKQNQIGLLAIALGLVIVAGVWFIKSRSLNSDLDRISYTMGHQIGTNLKREGIDINSRVLAQGIADVLQGRKIALSSEQMDEVMKLIQAEAQKRLTETAEKNLAESQQFLKENGARSGITTLQNGLQVETLKKGTGKQPHADSTVVVRYTGRLVSGEVFDSTNRQGPTIELKMSQVFNGLRLGLLTMREGSALRVFIPPELGYGASPRPGIPPQSVLIFDIELFKVK